MDKKTLEIANIYGTNLQMIDYMKETGSNDTVQMKAFQESALTGQKALVGRHFPQVEAAINAGRDEVEELFKNFYG